MSFMHHCLGICICNTTAQQAGIKAVGWCAVAKAVAACKEHKWCRVPLVINLYDRCTAPAAATPWSISRSSAEVTVKPVLALWLGTLRLLTRAAQGGT